MSNYFSPGVYVEEVPPTARPIAGVGTSTAAFIGVVPDDVVMPLRPGRTIVADQKPAAEDYYQVAPAGKSQLITDWEMFRQNFGDFSAANSILAHAVYGFFNNGGTRCWVQRVATANALKDPTAALAEQEAIDEIAIVAIPGAVTQTQQAALVAHCARMRDRVAVLDGASSDKLAVPGTIAPAPRSEDAGYAALYYPWIQVFDPVTQAPAAVPPAGHVAGIYARTDATRGVFKAPANEAIRGALDVTLRVSTAQQDGLNPEGVNVLRVMNGPVMVWGARTRVDEAHSEFRYVSTRRYMNFLRESVLDGTQWVVFEPNTPALWQRIVRNVSDFLLGQWRDGALFGATPAQAFQVRCDETTNPSDVRELGHVVTEIGVAIVKPAEFVIFRVQQTVGG
ncbi:phage tail sheath subtilisin-like domain-containing protein [Actinomadura sp. DC4]|uniref:phage tail sheath family protein n=1 Tax=Actinomadura sp. DC4 TaxID=3055069 RepID=UPI0025B1CD26|nr:phage tail sheath subtilisin-like domain-containing protein [Actinomadura sp. DC4]MDN3354877.1 phage tail sheath subtilisin-like domain-containing protein [Actinomadura sp. DC4]